MLHLMSKMKTMIRSDNQVYTRAGRTDLALGQAQGSHDKKNNAGAKTCKHLLTGGWCDKKHQRCPLLHLLFINQ